MESGEHSHHPENANVRDVDTTSLRFPAPRVCCARQLLTLRSPFLAEEPQATRARILAGIHPRLRSLKRRVPVDAEIVVAKAMAAERDHRYVSMEFLIEDLVVASSPERTRDAGFTMREALDGAAHRVGDRFAAQPRAEAAVGYALGSLYIDTGNYDSAEEVNVAGTIDADRGSRL
ncbi:MAG: hypothetical protein AAF628_14525 [Planctomycetota bacterium]